MSTFGLEHASVVVDSALDHGRAQGYLPLTVAVLDSGGHLVALKREDGSGILRPQIAFAKAWGALGMGFGTRELANRAQQAPAFVAALGDVSGGRIAPVPGGVLIRDAEGSVVAAVGISGDTSERDEECAVHGVEAAGLHPDTGAA